MMSVVIVFGGLAAVVGTLLAIDWLVAGRSERRNVRARDQQVGDLNVDPAVIQREAQSNQTQGNIGL
jgi:hypothetical protein